MRFEWNEDKRRLNEQKHGVTFEEARTVFYSDNALLFDDPDHSEEGRFLLLGPCMVGRVLVVVHCCREDGDIIRIISARKATRREEKAYLKQGGAK